MKFKLSCGGRAWGHRGDIPGYETRNGITEDGPLLGRPKAVTVLWFSVSWRTRHDPACVPLLCEGVTARHYSGDMAPWDSTERAAMVALLRCTPLEKAQHDLVQRITEEGSALALLDERLGPSNLFGDPV